MFYVYALKSTRNNDLYIGFTRDLRKRFSAHNSGLVSATKAYLPWTLVYYEAYFDIHDATRREKQLKEHWNKDELRNRLKYSLGALAKW